MTATDLSLATFKDTRIDGDGRCPTAPHMYRWFWVVGPAGAATVTFSLSGVYAWQVGRFSLISAYKELPDGGAYEISCRGLVWHWPQHRSLPPGVETEHADMCFEKEACEFLETHCRHWVGSSIGHEHLQDALAHDDEEYAFNWLKLEYRRFFVDGYEVEP